MPVAPFMVMTTVQTPVVPLVMIPAVPLVPVAAETAQPEAVNLVFPWVIGPATAPPAIETHGDGLQAAPGFVCALATSERHKNEKMIANV